MMARLIFDRTHFRMSRRRAAAVRLLSKPFARRVPRARQSLATWRTAAHADPADARGRAARKALSTSSMAPSASPRAAEPFRSPPAPSSARSPSCAGTGSATVTLEAGARYVEWPSDRLAVLCFERNPGAEDLARRAVQRRHGRQGGARLSREATSEGGPTGPPSSLPGPASPPGQTYFSETYLNCGAFCSWSLVMSMMP